MKTTISRNLPDTSSIPKTKPRLISLLAVAALFGLPTATFGVPIIDTGPGSQGQGGLTLYQGQWIYSEFNVSNAIIVTEIMGWLGYGAGEIRISLSNDGGDSPGNRLYSDTFLANSTTGWQGVTSIDWLIAPGTYWIGFEVDSDSQFLGVMPGPSSSPLLNEAFYYPNGIGFLPHDDINIGVRISGDVAVSSVPDAGSSVTLLGMALTGICVMRRKFRQGSGELTI